jgi:hypothetical protein
VDADTLNALVSGAIWRAEQLEERGVGSASQAWIEVSQLEEQLAGLLPASEPEGRIARRGAVRAALKARDHARARALADRYRAEPGPKTLRTELQRMLDEDAEALAKRFRYAVKRHPVHEARDLAQRLRKGGAFGLAA